MFDQQCIDTLIEGTDLFGMFEALLQISNGLRRSTKRRLRFGPPGLTTVCMNKQYIPTNGVSCQRNVVLVRLVIAVQHSTDIRSLMVQPDLQQAIRDRRFPTYLTPIKDMTDDVLRDILPTPSDIQYLADLFTQASNAKWVQQFRRLKMPRPSKRASLKTIHPDAKIDFDVPGRKSTRSATPKTPTPPSSSAPSSQQSDHNSRLDSDRSHVKSTVFSLIQAP